MGRSPQKDDEVSPIHVTSIAYEPANLLASTSFLCADTGRVWVLTFAPLELNFLDKCIHLSYHWTNYTNPTQYAIMLDNLIVTT